MNTRVASKFQIGKSYIFIGYPLIMDPKASLEENEGKSFHKSDSKIAQWMDRKPRKCLNTDPIDGTEALFENIFFIVNGRKLSWGTCRPYKAYLKAGMFLEVSF